MAGSRALLTAPFPPLVQMREEASKKRLEEVQLPMAVPGAAADIEMAEAGAGAVAAPAATAAAPKAEEPKRPEADGLPDGWAVAYDAQKRPYYWHRVTKRVTWEKPTAETPIT